MSKASVQNKISPDGKQEQKQTDVQKAGLAGAVRQVMETRYKAHQKAGSIIQGKIETEYIHSRLNFILTFNEKGNKTEEQIYGTNGIHLNTFNEKGLQVKSVEHDNKGSLSKTTTYSYNERGQLLEFLVINAEGRMQHRMLYIYREDGKPLEFINYFRTEERIHEKTVYTYDEKGNQIAVIQYDGDNNIKRQSHFKYNEQGKQVEHTTEYTDKKMAAYNLRHTNRYNEKGDCIEYTVYNGDGTVKNSHSYTYEYDSEGNRIIPHRDIPDPHAKKPGETEQCEMDVHGNWIKKTTFYNNVPVNIIIREITYFGEPEKTLVHPLTNPVVKATETLDISYTPEKLTEKQAKWLVDSPNTTAENFSNLRYYAFRYEELPSVINYTGPHIEALVLRDLLKENMNAQEIHSYSTVWNGNTERVHRYTLIFPHRPGYLLCATGINGDDEEEFIIPHSIDSHHDGYVYFSQFQLLRPSEASGIRDEYFEEELDEYIARCSLRKKPEKPVINMIQVKNNSFSMVEHAVDDDFEIKDLDVNYGYGFEKFHKELMHRFNTSTKGLVLFHGQPGTGKTYYIRHLLRKMVSHKKVVIYMPPNMVDHLVEPGFMTFLTGEVQHWSENGNFCVLLIEDAEPLLAKRQEGVRIQGVTNLLNMSDGLLNDMLNLQIICTFNVDLRKLDSALLRPGRLIARKEFKALSELDANLLAQRLGIKHHFKGSATLGEIYAMRKNSNTLIHDVEPEKDASTEIDDLV